MSKQETAKENKRPSTSREKPAPCERTRELAALGGRSVPRMTIGADDDERADVLAHSSVPRSAAWLLDLNARIGNREAQSLLAPGSSRAIDPAPAEPAAVALRKPMPGASVEALDDRAEADAPSQSSDKPPTVQAKLFVGAENEPLEKEADVIADLIMSSRAFEGPGGDGDGPGEAPVGWTRAPTSGRPFGLEVPETLANDVLALEFGGHQMAPGERAFFEAKLGVDLAEVRLHTGGQAAALCFALGARAFTFGRHIAVSNHVHAFDTTETRLLMAHELVHVLQQGALTLRAPRHTSSGLSAQGDHAGPVSGRLRVTRGDPSVIMRKALPPTAIAGFIIYPDVGKNVFRVFRKDKTTGSLVPVAEVAPPKGTIVLDHSNYLWIAEVAKRAESARSPAVGSGRDQGRVTVEISVDAGFEVRANQTRTQRVEVVSREENEERSADNIALIKSFLIHQRMEWKKVMREQWSKDHYIDQEPLPPDLAGESLTKREMEEVSQWAASVHQGMELKRVKREQWIKDHHVDQAPLPPDLADDGPVVKEYQAWKYEHDSARMKREMKREFMEQAKKRLSDGTFRPVVTDEEVDDLWLDRDLELGRRWNPKTKTYDTIPKVSREEQWDRVLEHAQYVRETDSRTRAQIDQNARLVAAGLGSGPASTISEESRSAAAAAGMDLPGDNEWVKTYKAMTRSFSGDLLELAKKEEALAVTQFGVDSPQAAHWRSAQKGYQQARDSLGIERWRPGLREEKERARQFEEVTQTLMRRYGYTRSELEGYSIADLRALLRRGRTKKEMTAWEWEYYVAHGDLPNEVTDSDGNLLGYRLIKYDERGAGGVVTSTVVDPGGVTRSVERKVVLTPVADMGLSVADLIIDQLPVVSTLKSFLQAVGGMSLSFHDIAMGGRDLSPGERIEAALGAIPSLGSLTKVARAAGMVMLAKPALELVTGVGLSGPEIDSLLAGKPVMLTPEEAMRRAIIAGVMHAASTTQWKIMDAHASGKRNQVYERMREAALREHPADASTSDHAPGGKQPQGVPQPGGRVLDSPHPPEITLDPVRAREKIDTPLQRAALEAEHNVDIIVNDKAGDGIAVKFKVDESTGLVTNITVTIDRDAMIKDFARHLPTIVALKEYQGVTGRGRLLLGSLKERLGLKVPPRPGEPGFRVVHEVNKLKELMADRVIHLENASPEIKAGLLKELKSLRDQLTAFQKKVDDPDWDPNTIAMRNTGDPTTAPQDAKPQILTDGRGSGVSNSAAIEDLEASGPLTDRSPTRDVASQTRAHPARVALVHGSGPGLGHTPVQSSAAPDVSPAPAKQTRVTLDATADASPLTTRSPTGDGASHTGAHPARVAPEQSSSTLSSASVPESRVAPAQSSSAPPPTLGPARPGEKPRADALELAKKHVLSCFWDDPQGAMDKWGPLLADSAIITEFVNAGEMHAFDVVDALGVPLVESIAGSLSFEAREALFGVAARDHRILPEIRAWVRSHGEYALGDALTAMNENFNKYLLSVADVTSILGFERGVQIALLLRTETGRKGFATLVKRNKGDAVRTLSSLRGESREHIHETIDALGAKVQVLVDYQQRLHATTTPSPAVASGPRFSVQAFDGTRTIGFGADGVLREHPVRKPMQHGDPIDLAAVPTLDDAQLAKIADIVRKHHEAHDIFNNMGMMLEFAAFLRDARAHNPDIAVIEGFSMFSGSGVDIVNKYRGGNCVALSLHLQRELAQAGYPAHLVGSSGANLLVATLDGSIRTQALNYIETTHNSLLLPFKDTNGAVMFLHVEIDASFYEPQVHGSLGKLESEGYGDLDRAVLNPNDVALNRMRALDTGFIGRRPAPGVDGGDSPKMMLDMVGGVLKLYNMGDGAAVGGVQRIPFVTLMHEGKIDELTRVLERVRDTLDLPPDFVENMKTLMELRYTNAYQQLMLPDAHGRYADIDGVRPTLRQPQTTDAGTTSTTAPWAPDETMPETLPATQLRPEVETLPATPPRPEVESPKPAEVPKPASGPQPAPWAAVTTAPASGSQPGASVKPAPASGSQPGTSVKPAPAAPWVAVTTAPASGSRPGARAKPSKRRSPRRRVAPDAQATRAVRSAPKAGSSTLDAHAGPPVRGFGSGQVRMDANRRVSPDAHVPVVERPSLPEGLRGSELEALADHNRLQELVWALEGLKLRDQAAAWRTYLESEMQHARAVYLTPLGGGFQKTFIIALEGGLYGVWKPYLHKAGMEWANRPWAEVAAYHATRELGVSAIPVTVQRTINGMVGSLQVFVPDRMTPNQVFKDKNAGGLRQKLGPKWWGGMPSVLDYILGNKDRNGGNWLIAAFGPPILIDHGATFHSNPAIMGEAALIEAFSDPGVLRDFLEVDSAQYIKAIEPYVPSEMSDVLPKAKERLEVVQDMLRQLERDGKVGRRPEPPPASQGGLAPSGTPWWHAAAERERLRQARAQGGANQPADGGNVAPAAPAVSDHKPAAPAPDLRDTMDAPQPEIPRPAMVIPPAVDALQTPQREVPKPAMVSPRPVGLDGEISKPAMVPGPVGLDGEVPKPAMVTRPMGLDAEVPKPAMVTRPVGLDGEIPRPAMVPRPVGLDDARAPATPTKSPPKGSLPPPAMLLPDHFEPPAIHRLTAIGDEVVDIGSPELDSLRPVRNFARQTTHDDVTGFLSGGFFDESLDASLDHSRAHPEAQVHVFNVEFKNMAGLNPTLGTAQVNQILGTMSGLWHVAVAEYLKSHGASADLYRVGGPHVALHVVGPVDAQVVRDAVTHAQMKVSKYTETASGRVLTPEGKPGAREVALRDIPHPKYLLDSSEFGTGLVRVGDVVTLLPGESGGQFVARVRAAHRAGLDAIGERRARRNPSAPEVHHDPEPPAAPRPAAPAFAGAPTAFVPGLAKALDDARRVEATLVDAQAKRSLSQAEAALLRDVRGIIGSVERLSVDAVTDLSSRAVLIPYLKDAIRWIEKSADDEAFFVFGDVRNLSGLNDALGAAAADVHFREMVRHHYLETLKARLPGCAVIGFRMGGDEFGVLLLGDKLADDHVRAAMWDASQAVKDYVNTAPPQQTVAGKTVALAEVPHRKLGKRPGTGEVSNYIHIPKRGATAKGVLDEMDTMDAAKNAKPKAPPRSLGPASDAMVAALAAEGLDVQVQEGLGDAIEVHFDVDPAHGWVSGLRVVVGEHPKLEDAAQHREVIALLRRYAGPGGRRELIIDKVRAARDGRRFAAPGSVEFKVRLEEGKLPALITRRLDELDHAHEPAARRRLLDEIAAIAKQRREIREGAVDMSSAELRRIAVGDTGYPAAPVKAAPNIPGGDLRLHERDDRVGGEGGHTIQRHCGHSPEALAARLRASRDATGSHSLGDASSFRDVADASLLVNIVLRDHKDHIDRWVEAAGRGMVPRQKVLVSDEFRRSTGHKVERGNTMVYDCHRVKIVLVYKPGVVPGSPFYILTANPI